MSGPRVAVVLPPSESFSPGSAGAIGLLVHRLAPAGGTVVGRPQACPFPDAPFCPAPPARWWPPKAVDRYASGVARVLRQLEPDLVEVHNRPAVALRLHQALPRVPLTLVLHNDPQGMRGARSPAQRRRLLSSMAVACVSRFLRARFLDGLGLPEQAVAVLPNCIDLEALPPPLPDAGREQLMLFAGRVVADKGADSFVDACAAVLEQRPGWRAAMIGADRFGPDSPDTAFLRTLRPRAEAAGVSLLGHQPHEAVLRAMAQAAIVVVPSRWAEPFGMTALEAMASGAALVCAPRGGLPEVVGEAALLAGPDAPGLAQALLHLTADPVLRTALAAAGRARAQEFDAVRARLRLAEHRRLRWAAGQQTC